MAAPIKPFVAALCVCVCVCVCVCAVHVGVGQRCRRSTSTNHVLRFSLMYDRFVQDYKVGVHQPPCNATCRTRWGCMLSAVRDDGFRACVAAATSDGRGGGGGWNGSDAAIAMATVALVVAGVAVVFFAALRARSLAKHRYVFAHVLNPQPHT
jgi:hypothetical protein